MPAGPNEKLYHGAAIDPPTEMVPSEFAYAELDVTTNFSFLRGASHPDELVYTAARLGYRAMAVTDVNSLAGVVRAFEAARKIKGFKLIVGARLAFSDGTNDLLVWPTNRNAYARLCKLLTIGRRRAEKGECHLRLDDFLDHHEGLLAAVVSPDASRVHLDSLQALHDELADRLSLAVSLHHAGDDEAHLDAFIDLSRRTKVPLLATNQVHFHDENRRMLQDVLTCVREGCTIHEAGFRLYANGERYLKSSRQMHQLFARHPQAIERGLEIARRCTFSLDQLKYEYPTEAAPPNVSPSRYLRDLTYEHAQLRYPQGIPQRVLDLLEKELNFICGSKYESYFLTVFDLVRFARSKGILCQGRGSAANSAVCYCLGVTSVDPNQFQLVFERFASSARAEPPDIDIDFEHERREEVIQYVYEKYGRDRAGMTASLTTYRGRSAIRDVGKVLGFGQDMLDQLAGKLDWWHSGSLKDSQLREVGVNPSDPGIQRLIELTRELLGFPRHLSQHVGGMVIARSPLNELVPVENAAMKDRTVIEWDKDDLDVIGLFKVDILALGMLTAISKGLALINDRNEITTGQTPVPPKLIELHTIPPEDPQTYEMLCDADSVGVFQVESRAQMSMLPRLQPRKFYDLVVEVAIVRPGPIQGKMVHPYLQRREKLRLDPGYRVEYPKPELEEVLHETLGVPLFQEQAMRLAMVAARFTPEEADQLRRAMAAWKRHGGIGKFHHKFINGMLNNGYDLDFAERCFQQISGFGEYGFPESHAASFARLVYASSWLKRHHPAAFTCALLNSQPMGFYAPAQLVRDARQHGVEVRPIDVNESDWDCTLEDRHSSERGRPDPADKQTWGCNGPALRLGFRQIKGLKESEMKKLIHARTVDGPFDSIDDLQHRAQLQSSTIRRLADADAFASMKMSRRHAAWDALALDTYPQPLPDRPKQQRRQLLLPIMPAIEETLADYSTTGLTLRDHPLSFVRPALDQMRVIPSVDLIDSRKCPANKFVRVAGLVLCRQRPGTASGVVFITLEDETGIANLIVWNHVYEKFRPAARHATLLQVDGLVQREGKVIHVLARQLHDRSDLLSGLVQRSRDFH